MGGATVSIPGWTRGSQEQKRVDWVLEALPAIKMELAVGEAGGD